MAGAVRAGRAFIELFYDKTRLQRQGRQLRNTVQNSMRGLNSIAAFTGLGTAGFGFAQAIKSASDFQESVNRLRNILRQAAPAALRWSESLSVATGRTQKDILDATSSFTAFFLGMGRTRQEAFRLAKQVTELGIDFSSANNLDQAEVFQRFLAAINGSNVVLDQFGVNLKGIGAGMEASEASAVRLEAIFKQLGQQGVIGDALRTAGDAANTFKRFENAVNRLSNSLGSSLLPVATKLVDALAGIAEAADISRLAKSGLDSAGQALVVGLTESELRVQQTANKLFQFGGGLPGVGGIISTLGPVARQFGEQRAEQLQRRLDNERQKLQSAVNRESRVIKEEKRARQAEKGTLNADALKAIGGAFTREFGQRINQADDIARAVRTQFRLRKDKFADFFEVQDRKKLTRSLGVIGQATFSGKVASASFVDQVGVERKNLEENKKQTNWLANAVELLRDIKLDNNGVAFR